MTKTFLTEYELEDGRVFSSIRIHAPTWEIAQAVLDHYIWELDEVPKNTILVGELVYEAPYQGIIHPN
jgi:hypothetical protein